MTFRSLLLLASLALALAPLVFLGVRAREGVTVRLSAQYAERVAALADGIERDLAREAELIGARLQRLAEAIAADNRFRLAVQGHEAVDRAYLLDYAGRVMPLAGLDVLRIHDETGRVLSSGHFRNEFDAVDPALPAALRRAGAGGALAVLPTPSGPVVALTRVRELRLGARTLFLVGGSVVDARFLEGLGRGAGRDVLLEGPEEILAALGSPTGTAARAGRGAPLAGPSRAVDGASTGGVTGGRPGAGGASAGSARVRPMAGKGTDPMPALVREVPIRVAGAGPDTAARFVVSASVAPLEEIRREMDRRLLVISIAAAALAALLALLASTWLSRPLAELARRAERVDLDRPEVSFDTRRSDEIGALARVLNRMTARLRASAARLREAERRATIGEIARQVNHDVRNGLIPIRNVVAHLAEVARERPSELQTVFRERQGTLESGIAYLQTLATNYARLSPARERRPCDVNEVAREAALHTGDVAASDRTGYPRGAGRVEGGDVARGAHIALDLALRLPPVHADPVALRRILENLVVNAVESLEGGQGTVRITTRLDRGDDGPIVRVTVSDTGRGMDAAERARIFDDFYTTKPHGTGLGLSIVRRLVNDLGGRITVESEPGRGSSFTVELPAGAE